MADILNLALPYFWPDLHRLCLRQDQGTAGIRSRLDELLPAVRFLPALLFRIMSETPFSELNNPAIPDRDHACDRERLRSCHGGGPHHRRTLAAQGHHGGLAGAYGNIGYMGPGLALAVLGAKAAAPTALIFCCDSIFLFSIVPLLMALTDREHPSFLHAIGIAARQIVLNPLIMSAAAGALCRGAAHSVAGRRSTARCCFCRTRPRPPRCSCSASPWRCARSIACPGKCPA